MVSEYSVKDTSIIGVNEKKSKRDTVKPGTLIDGKYKIERLIGEGRFGEVYQAIDIDINAKRAMKIIKTESESSMCIKIEARMLNLCSEDGQHANIVRFYDVQTKGEYKYIVLEYIDGRDLSIYRKEICSDNIPEKRLLDIAKQIAKGLQFIHGKQIIHKDLKPQNILITNDDKATIKITDFGISHQFCFRNDRASQASNCGTACYMSPEQLKRDDVSYQTDVWSYGILLNELLTGERPYNASKAHDVLNMIESKPFQSLNNVSPFWGFLLNKCLEYDHQKRFKSFDEILIYLESWPLLPPVEPHQLAVYMVEVPGGTGLIGSKKRNNEYPIHQVIIDSFLLGKYPVTVRQWRSVYPEALFPEDEDSNPVSNINWYEAIEFCNRLSKLKGLKPVYSMGTEQSDSNNESREDSMKIAVVADWKASGFRLPTEAEWEYAARFGQPEKYPYSGGKIIDQVAQYQVNAKYDKQNVGLKRGNEMEIYDMSGNVFEWCWDWYSSSYYRSCPKNNPKGPFRGDKAVIRGGSSCSSPEQCEVSFRESKARSFKDRSIGFRLCRKIDP